MWHQPLKHLLMAPVGLGLLVPGWITGQDQPAAAQAGQPQDQNPADYRLYSAILAEIIRHRDQGATLRGSASKFTVPITRRDGESHPLD